MSSYPGFDRGAGALDAGDVLRLIRDHGSAAPEYLTGALHQHERMVELTQDRLLRQAGPAPPRSGPPLGTLRQPCGAALIRAGTRLQGAAAVAAGADAIA
ncbi:MAG TPA: hypothetical protein VFI22_09950 [Thermomicrobiales bacterium]|nr:hypothetical protein [Thermomicrobiales bacterium]